MTGTLGIPKTDQHSALAFGCKQPRPVAHERRRTYHSMVLDWPMRPSSSRVSLAVSRSWMRTRAPDRRAFSQREVVSCRPSSRRKRSAED